MEVRKGTTPLRQYVDGGVREYAGLQLAIEAGADEIYVILLNPAGSEPMERPFGSVETILLRTIDILLKDVGEHDLKIPAFYNRMLRFVDATRRRLRESGISEQEIDVILARETEPFFNQKPPHIHLVRPSHPLEGGPGGLAFSPQAMTRMMWQGERDLSLYLATAPSAGGGNV
jgi:hypothetical protein